MICNLRNDIFHPLILRLPVSLLLLLLVLASTGYGGGGAVARAIAADAARPTGPGLPPSAPSSTRSVSGVHSASPAEIGVFLLTKKRRTLALIQFQIKQIGNCIKARTQPATRAGNVTSQVLPAGSFSFRVCCSGQRHILQALPTTAVMMDETLTRPSEGVLSVSPISVG